MLGDGRAKALVIGHRGAPLVAPENTLASVRVASDAGADGVEIDVQRTRDGTLVVMHDATLDRTTDGSGRVCDADLSELCDMHAGWWFDSGSRGEHPWREVPRADVGVPTLEELLEVTGELGLAVNVEVKNLPGAPGYTKEPEVALAAAAMVVERGDTDRVVMSSFNGIDMAAVRRAHPELMATWLTLPAYDPREALREALRLGLSGLHPGHDALAGHAAAEIVAAARAQGMPWIGAWTVDDPVEVRRLSDAGVAAVITNAPDLAVAALA